MAWHARDQKVKSPKLHPKSTAANLETSPNFLLLANDARSSKPTVMTTSDL
jgi:hypothetical protein